MGRRTLRIFATIVIGCAMMIGCSRSEPAQPTELPTEQSQISQPDPIQTRDISNLGQKRSSSVWPYLTFLSLLITSLALFLAYQMLRWRKTLPYGQKSILPEEVIKLTEHSAEMNRRQMLEARDNTNELREIMNEVRQAFGVFSQEASKKNEEIDRLKSGSDKLATIQMARRFIRVARFAKSDIREDAAAGRDTSALESILLHLNEALADAGFESFEVERGSDYRETRSAAKGPEVTITDDTSLDWQVADTVDEGYQIQTANGPLVVEPAIVRIYRQNT